MTRVFLLMTGSYEDRHVGAVFSTSDRAHSVANAFDRCQVEEHEIDLYEWEIPLGRTAFRVIMRRDGDPLSVSKASLGDSTPAKFFRMEYRMLPIGSENPAWLYALQPEAFKYARSLAPKYLIADVFARDKQQAIEITKGGRDLLIASEQWPIGVRDVEELRCMVAEKFGAEDDRDFIIRASQDKGDREKEETK